MKRYIFHALESGPKAIARILRVFPTDRLDERLEPNRFSAREVISHLADIEEVHFARCKKGVANPGYKIDPLDIESRSHAHHYADKDVYHEAEVFDSRREMLMDYLRGLTDEELHTKVVAPSGDDIDVLTYAMSIVSHDMYHLEQLTMYLANEAALLH
ncbi:MAG: DinB family protein [Armatimonadetes bacterium]|nr:DinB family protein [Armatimonadota bacterium]